MKKENLLLLIGSLVLAVLLFSSCKKEQVTESPVDVGRTYVRIQEVDKDGKTQNSTINLVIVKY
jgi:hypothetical protein